MTPLAIDLWRYEVAIWRVIYGTTVASFFCLIAGFCAAAHTDPPRWVAIWFLDLSGAFFYADMAAVAVQYAIMLPLQIIADQRSATIFDHDEWRPL